MIKTIIFDLGGVLIDWNPDYVYKQLLPDAEVRSFFFKNICTYEWNMQCDAGKPVAEAMAEKVAEWPGWEPYINAYYGRWEEMLGGPIPETVELFKKLHERGTHRIVALTNWSAETFPVALARYDFLHWFEGIVVSGDEKTRKPYPTIYQTILDRYDIDPKSAIFIDDSLANVEAGEKLGIKGIHFQDAADLERRLQSLRVLV